MLIPVNYGGSVLCPIESLPADVSECGLVHCVASLLLIMVPRDPTD